MADSLSPQSAGGSKHSSPTKAETRTIFSFFSARQTMFIAYGLTFACVACTAFFLLNPSSYSSPWLKSFLRTSSYRSHFSSLLSYFHPNSSQLNRNPLSFSQPPTSSFQVSRERDGFYDTTGSLYSDGKSEGPEIEVVNQTGNSHSPYSSTVSLSRDSNDTSQSATLQFSGEEGFSKNSSLNESFNANGTKSPGSSKSLPQDFKGTNLGDNQFALETGNGKEGLHWQINGAQKGVLDKERFGSGDDYFSKQKEEASKELMGHCDIFDGRWVRDDSYPLYAPGSCPHIDEPFNCFLNGRPDRVYEKYRWQPKGCNIPRLNGKHMLELLRGKRLVFVGDSLNRNMWESLVCVLQNSVEDKSRVFEASGRHEFRMEGSYSFIFTDYNCSVDYFRTPFLVQEGEMPDTNGSNKETLRLDVIEESADKYKDADILIFNTGHWWTHEKTSKGRGYYQEGSTIYDHLNVKEAFRKALTTWGRWIDAKIDPKKTHVFFRGYSDSHFRGGRWNSGGQCDGETEPIENVKYLKKYPSKMRILELVLKGMKTPVLYLNATRLTGFRKDAHPSIYRKQNVTQEERRSQLRFQDCSHWCLPGVPDTWNELLYAQILAEYKQRKQRRLHQEPQR